MEVLDLSNPFFGRWIDDDDPADTVPHSRLVIGAPNPLAIDTYAALSRSVQDEILNRLPKNLRECLMMWANDWTPRDIADVRHEPLSTAMKRRNDTESNLIALLQYCAQHYPTTGIDEQLLEAWRNT